MLPLERKVVLGFTLIAPVVVLVISLAVYPFLMGLLSELYRGHRWIAELAFCGDSELSDATGYYGKWEFCGIA